MRAPALLGVLLSTVLAPALQAQNYGAFSFLRLDPSPRAAALAGAVDAVATDDPAGLFYNPGLLTTASANSISFTYVNHLADVNAGSLAYARTVKGIDAAVGVRFLGYGDLEEANEVGEKTGTFSANSLALTAGAATQYGERLRYGASVSFVTAGIASERGTAVSADLGATYALPGALTVAATVRGAGVTLNSLGNSTDRLPLDVRLGVSKRLRYLPILISATGYDLQDPNAGPEDRSGLERVLGHLGVGGELQFSRAFQARLGFSPRRNQELSTQKRLDPTGLSLGFGLRVQRFAFDYTFATWGETGALHLFGLRSRL